MRLIPLFKLPQTEHFMDTWKAGRTETKEKSVFRPTAIQKYAAAAAAPRGMLVHSAGPLLPPNAIFLYQKILILTRRRNVLTNMTLRKWPCINQKNLPQQRQLLCLWSPHEHSLSYSVTSSVRVLATGWTVHGSNPGMGEIYRTRADRPHGPYCLLYHVYRIFFLELKRPGCDADHSPNLALWLKKEWSYTSTYLLDLYDMSLGELIFSHSIGKPTHAHF